jgi:hypothetical protein
MNTGANEQEVHPGTPSFERDAVKFLGVFQPSCSVMTDEIQRGCVHLYTHQLP